MSDDFKIAYKRLKKRHRSLEADFERLLLSLMENPEQGVELIEGVRKIRLAISSKRRGRSGGARVIIRARIVEDEFNLFTSTIKQISRTLVMPPCVTYSKE
jgi:mRNA-degrading endonuclease RelE of RelBE toxin-antitoxin system